MYDRIKQLFIIMQASIYRRNYYLIRVHSENKFPTDQNRERQVYSQTARVINEMISHTKALLFKANSVRQQLQNFNQQHDELCDVDELIQSFKEFQRTLPLTFFSQYPIDNQMTGPFVLRLIKEISYWRKYLPLLEPLIEDIDQIFQEQKKASSQNISLIYFMMLKRVITDSNEYFRKLRTKIAQHLKQTDQEQAEKEKEAHIFLVPTFRQAHNNQSLKKFKDALVQRMNDAISTIYKCIDVVSFEAVDKYITELTTEDNIDLLAKKQYKRNKKLKKEVKVYRIDYSEFLDKKQHNQQKKRFRKHRSSNAILSLNKHNLLIVNPSQKSLPNRSSKILLPQIKSLGKEVVDLAVMPRKRKLSKQNSRNSKFSLDKKKIPIGKYKQNKVHLKLKL